MKVILSISIILMLIGCSNQVASNFLDNCNCTSVILTDKKFEDSLGHFSINIPEGNWYQSKNLDENGNGISLLNDDVDSIISVSVTEIAKSVPWPNRDLQQQDINAQFNVVKSGEIDLLGELRMWNYIKHDDGMKSLFITVEHPKENRFVTIAIWVEQDYNHQEEICKLEAVIDSFKYY